MGIEMPLGPNVCCGPEDRSNTGTGEDFRE